MLLVNLPAKATAIQQTIGKAVAANQLEGQTKLLHHSLLTLISRQVSWLILLRLLTYVGELKDFAIQPYKFGQLSQVVGPLVGRPNGFNLVEYADDQWTVNAGVGRKLNENGQVMSL